MAILALVLFFFIIKDRYTRRAAIISTLVLATSSWYLHYARMGYSGFLSIVLILGLIYVATHMNNKYKLAWLLALVGIAAIGLYTPYFLYLLIAGVILSLATIKPNMKNIKGKDAGIATGLVLVLIAPLVYSIVQDTEVAKALLVIPDQFPSVTGYFRNIYDVVAYVIFKSEPMPMLHLGDLPMLEIFSVSMVALGLYHYDHELSKKLSRLILGGLLVVILLLGFNANQLHYSLLIPFVYFLLAGGLVVLFTQWNEIFPKNPIARLIAIVPITILLIIVAQYHTQRYFVAWPRTPEVVQQYPATYTALESELRANSAMTTVLVSEQETQITSPLAIYYDSTKFTDSALSAFSKDDGNRLIITDTAYKELSTELRKSLGDPSRIVNGAFASQPVVLLVYDVSM